MVNKTAQSIQSDQNLIAEISTLKLRTMNLQELVNNQADTIK